MEILLRRLALVVCAIAIAVAIGSTGYILIEGYTPLEAIYMSLMTVTTVGYGEVRKLSDAGRIFNSFFMLLGASTLFLAIGVVTQTVIELEFSHYFSKRRTKRMIENLKDHYIVCGYGRVGRNAAQELHREGVPVIVLERNEAKVESAMHSGLLGALGDATLDSNLRGVGIDRAIGLIAALASDADNLFLVLSAKTLNAKLKISARVLEEEAESKMRRAGADTVLAPYSITGARLAQAILRPHVVQFLDFATIGLTDVGIEQVAVNQDSVCVKRSLADLQIRREIGVIILGIRRASGEMLFNPDATVSLDAGDHLIAMGNHEQLQRLERLAQPRRA
ncbi:MAG: potassium channel protein [Bryobacteraceae bacterium]|nr:potassium channel protein [Bryobacteraceae bacterium]